MGYKTQSFLCPLFLSLSLNFTTKLAVSFSLSFLSFSSLSFPQLSCECNPELYRSSLQFEFVLRRLFPFFILFFPSKFCSLASSLLLHTRSLSHSSSVPISLHCALCLFHFFLKFIPNLLTTPARQAFVPVEFFFHTILSLSLSFPPITFSPQAPGSSS